MILKVTQRHFVLLGNDKFTGVTIQISGSTLDR